MKIRVIRVLVYEGEENWVKNTLSKNATPLNTSLGTIREKELWQDMTFVDAEEPHRSVNIQDLRS